MRVVKAVIVGAGLGGIAAAHHLKRVGIEDLVLLEAGDSVGGTWRENTYPGCACDVPVALYQFSFAPSISWKHVYPRAAEMHAYCRWLVEALGLEPHLELNSAVAQATWDEARARWRVETAGGKLYEAEIVVAALGQLNRPQWPEIEGRQSFAGPTMHSARWDASIALDGKRVGVIGSAASAVQLVPEIAKIAADLRVFQRSPNYLLPRNDREITSEEIALLMTAPQIAALGRDFIYQQADHLFWQAFAWTKEGRAFYTAESRRHLEKQVADPALRDRLWPDYPIGCKRVLFCDDYYPALQRENTALVTDAIVRIEPEGVRTRDGRLHPLDTLIFATGFETTAWNWSMEVYGRGGQRLKDVWADGPEAYLGIAVSGFPNFFMTYGPNTNLGHNSISFMIERQAEYIARAAAGLAARNAAAMEVKRAAQTQFNEMLQRDLAKTAWADPACASWYKTAGGRITQNWGSHTRAYAEATAEVAWADYEVAGGTG